MATTMERIAQLEARVMDLEQDRDRDHEEKRSNQELRRLLGIANDRIVRLERRLTRERSA